MNQKEAVYQVIREGIIQSTKEPDYVGVSSVTLSDRMGIDRETVETCIQELVDEGRLIKKSSEQTPMNEVFLLPE